MCVYHADTSYQQSALLPVCSHWRFSGPQLASFEGADGTGFSPISWIRFSVMALYFVSLYQPDIPEAYRDPGHLLFTIFAAIHHALWCGFL